MKGLVFTELLEMIEENFSQELAEQIISQSKLHNDGAYTSVGTYDHHELLRIVSNLSLETQISITDLEKAYGRYLFKKLQERYKNFVIQHSTR